MAFGQDKCVGTLLLATFSSSFAYFTFWLLILPFVDDDNPIQNLFPHRFVTPPIGKARRLLYPKTICFFNLNLCFIIFSHFPEITEPSQ